MNITVPQACDVLTIGYYHRLAIATANLCDENGVRMSRREIPNWMADCLFREDVRFVYADGAPFFIGDTAIDDAFENDGSFRWLSDLRAYAESPPRQAPQARLYDRLVLLSLSFWVADPDIATGFASDECLRQPQCGHWAFPYFQDRCATCPFKR